MESQNSFLNISFYQFFPWPEFEAHRQSLKTELNDRNLRGTILLSPEGINGFVCGLPAAVREFVGILRETLPLRERLEPKESFSSKQSFRRTLVKCKKEIIPMGRPDGNPIQITGQRLEPKQLKQWLDQDEDLILVDTRNDYEIGLGTFEKAVDFSVKVFRDFPERLLKHKKDWANKKVVMFCTGGIRCEKTTAFALKNGFENVYQLEGGILKYFEDCGGAHYKGDCFVFDQRTAVHPDLSPSGHVTCHECLYPLSPSEQADPRFIVDTSCPYCFDRKSPNQAQIPSRVSSPPLSDHLSY